MMIRTLGQACEKCGWEVHAWVLMANHFHFIIHTPQGHLVEGMKWFMNTYTRRLNSRHRLWGRVFGDRYKSSLIEPPDYSGSTDYLRTVISYVHLNPVRARLIERGDKGWDWLQYPWNSLNAVYCASAAERPQWAHAKFGLGLEQCDDTGKGRSRYLRRLDALADDWFKNSRKVMNPAASRRKTRRRKPSVQLGALAGWYQGSVEFKGWALERVAEALPKIRNRNYRTSDQLSDHSVRRAQELIVVGCRVLGCELETLKALSGSDPRKLGVRSRGQSTILDRWPCPTTLTHGSKVKD